MMPHARNNSHVSTNTLRKAKRFVKADAALTQEGAHHGTIVIPAARARLELLRCWSWFWTVRLRHVNSIIQSCD